MRRSVLLLAAVCAAFVPTLAAANTLPTQPQGPAASTVVAQPTTVPSVDDAMTPGTGKLSPVVTAPPVAAPPKPPATRPAPPPPPATTKAAPAPRTVRLAPVTAYHSQAAVDQGNLVLWGSQPWRIAGHDDMGWAWLDDIPTGTIVIVTSGPATGRYKVVGHRWSPTKGDAVMPAWMAGYDLILQTCTGSTGTGFTLAMRV